jgi:hypothetical protein
MPVIWTAADVIILKQAIVKGERRVRFYDGREVEYRSIDELMTALSLVDQSVTNLTTPVQRVSYGTYSKD